MVRSTPNFCTMATSKASLSSSDMGMSWRNPRARQYSAYSARIIGWLILVIYGFLGSVAHMHRAAGGGSYGLYGPVS